MGNLNLTARSLSVFILKTRSGFTLKSSSESLKLRSGFTLLELMITIAILAILSTMAVSSYKSYMMKSRRTSAYVLLQQMMNYAQQYYVQNNFTYPTSLANLYAPGSPPTSPYYTFTSVACTSANCGTPCFQIQASATATGGQSSDTNCKVLCIDSCGNRLAGSTTCQTDTNNCWNTQ